MDIDWQMVVVFSLIGLGAYFAFKHDEVVAQIPNWLTFILLGAILIGGIYFASSLGVLWVAALVAAAIVLIVISSKHVRG